MDCYRLILKYVLGPGMVAHRTVQEPWREESGEQIGTRGVGFGSLRAVRGWGGVVTPATPERSLQWWGMLPLQGAGLVKWGEA